ncbi:MAG: DUF397 domain-containing protein [Haloechinothrix sp.]
MNTHDPTELTTAWRKSSYSTSTGNCVEVAPAAGGVVLRHSKRPAAGTITFPPRAWATVVEEARTNLPSANGIVTITSIGAGTLVTALHTSVKLRFDPDEWTAFRAGANQGEFDLTDHHLASAPH